MNNLSQAERNYFIKKAGGSSPTEPLNNLKRKVYSAAGVNAQTPLDQMEKLWLLSIIAVPADNLNSIESLWRQAVVAIGQVPSNYLNDNKLKFYLNAP
jgi:hypothetical protein